MAIKKCFKCGKEKDVEEFYKHKMMKDGRLNKCIECARIDSRRHRIENIDAVREYDRARGMSPKRISENKKRMKKFIINNKEKYIAWNSAAYALARGKIVKKPCEVCGTTERIEMHHSDYSKPLDVVFLCSVHHKRAHGFAKDY